MNETDYVEDQKDATNTTEEEEQVREMIEVFESRHEMLQDEKVEPVAENVCLTQGEYYGLISTVISIVIVLITVTAFAGIFYRRYWSVQMKNSSADSTAPCATSGPYPPTRSNNYSFLMPGARKAFETSFSSSILRPPGCALEPHDGDMPVSTIPNVRTFDDPSEPIYTDPSLFERSRSLRSIAVSQAGQHCQKLNI